MEPKVIVIEERSLIDVYGAMCASCRIRVRLRRPPEETDWAE